MKPDQYQNVVHHVLFQNNVVHTHTSATAHVIFSGHIIDHRRVTQRLFRQCR